MQLVLPKRQRHLSTSPVRRSSGFRRKYFAIELSLNLISLFLHTVHGNEHFTNKLMAIDRNGLARKNAYVIYSPHTIVAA